MNRRQLLHTLIVCGVGATLTPEKAVILALSILWLWFVLYLFIEIAHSQDKERDDE